MASLFSYSPNGGENFCTVSEDNRLSVWTNETQQQFVDKNHLLSKCTSLDWFRTSQQKSNEQGRIALGFENGSVSVWDLQRGIVSRRLGKDLNLPTVSDVAFSSDGKSIFSSSSEKHILEWDVETGSEKRRLKADKNGTSKLSVSGATQCLAAGSLSIRLFDMDSGKCVKKLNGSHSSNISLLEFSKNGKFLVSGCSNVRLLNIFSISTSTAMDGNLLHSITLGHNPLSVSVFSSLNECVSLIACCERGSIEAHRIKTNESDSEVNSEKQTYDLKDNASLLGLKFKDETPQTHFTVAFGAISLPQSKTLQYAEGPDGLSAITDVNAPQGGEQQSGTTQITEILEGEHHLLGPSDKSNRSAESDLLVPASSSLKRLRSGVDERTIAERLEAMAEAIADSESNQKKLKSSASQTPKGESLVTVLEQALQSRDDGLLEECLVVTEEHVVTATVNRLPSTYVLPFLLLLSEKVERSPTRGLSLCVWMKAVFTTHASYLMSVPNLHLKLAGLYQILQDRSNIFPKLLNLNGRLDLALAQISSVSSTSRSYGNHGRNGHGKMEGEGVTNHTCYDETLEDALAQDEMLGDNASDEDDNGEESD